jgi:hypothetical protein
VPARTNSQVIKARSPFRVINRVVNVRPMVSFVSKHVGSGPRRLKMVRFWHELDHDSVNPAAPAEAFITP